MKALLRIIVTAGLCYAIWNHDALLPKPAVEANSNQLTDQAKLDDWRADVAAGKKTFEAHDRQIDGALAGGVSLDLTLKLMDRAQDNMVSDADRIIALLKNKPFGLALSQSESDLKAAMEKFGAQKRNAPRLYEPPQSSARPVPAATPQPGAWRLEKAHSTLGRPTPRVLSDQERMAEWAKRVQGQ